MSQAIKIIIVGPMQSGKTAISNYIAERTEGITQNYRPTVGTRILEFERDAPHNPKKPGQGKALVQLWDVSGNSKYDRCWPAIIKEANGIMFCYNAENPKHDQEMEGWLNYFKKKSQLPQNLQIVFAHHVSG